MTLPWLTARFFPTWKLEVSTCLGHPPRSRRSCPNSRKPRSRLPPPVSRARRTDHSTGYRLGGPKRVHGEILIRGEQRQGMPGKPDGSRGEGTPKRKWIDFVEYLVSSTLERAFGLLLLLIDVVHESVIASGGILMLMSAHWHPRCATDWRLYSPGSTCKRRR